MIEERQYMKITFKVGGFLFPRAVNAELVAEYAKKFIQLYQQGHHLLVVTGGGEVARHYIDVARRLGASESLCDQIGIQVSRINASLLVSGLKDIVAPSIPTRFEEALNDYTLRGLVIMGGLQPGQSTNAVAALLSEAAGVDMLVNLTDVDGVYSSDPKADSNARKFDEITPGGLAEIIAGKTATAGGYRLLDPVALKIIERSLLPTWIINGKDPSNVDRVLRKKRVGTRIVFR